MENEKNVTPGSVLNTEQLLSHWQGHRALTRRMIEAFPDDKLFTHSIGEMRTFAELIAELNAMGATGAHGVVTGEWVELKELAKDSGLRLDPGTKEEILRIWDWSTDYINRVWPQMKPERFSETDKAYGMYEGQVWWLLFYFIDNEIHHRGQGYVYLRSLGIEPPPFWDR